MFFLVSIFWLSFLLLFWTFLGYPIFVITASKVFSRRWRTSPFLGSISMIIAAHNEEKVIRDKVENCLALDFGPAKAEIFIVSDGSMDDTNTILEEFIGKSEQLKVITYQPRAGKANAINVAASKTQGEVLVFSDANVMISEKSCQSLLAPFADPEVGVVCGRVLVIADGDEEVAGESLYMKYEGAVQRAEALMYSMVGVDGALFAMRREFFRPLELETILDDFSLSMSALLSGKRIVYEKQAIAVEKVIPSAQNEMKRKTRIVSGGYQYLVNLFRQGKKLSVWMWFCFLSHKILRWAAPFLLSFVLLVNLLLFSLEFFRVLLFCQLCFYFLALLGHILKGLRRINVVYLPYYFCIVNIAAFLGFVQFLRTGETVLWEKVKR